MEVCVILTEKIKRKPSSKVALYFIIYLVAIQFIINSFSHGEVIYNYRLNYDLVKDRPTNIEAVLSEIKRIIISENLDEYVIILGDSVSYSSPGPANTSIGYYLNEKTRNEGKEFKVFNLAMPSMQVGDIYTILLKLDQYGISRDNVIINVLYGGFVERNPNPAPVFWLDRQLKDMDPDAYNYVNIQDDIEGSKSKIVALTDKVKYEIYENIPLFKYKDYLKVFAKEQLQKLKGQVVQASEQVQPWHKKAFLKELMREYQYQVGLNSTPFVMDSTNPQIYFLDKIIEIQEGKNTLVYLAPINEDLVGEYMDKDKYFNNVEAIDKYFEQKSVEYVNYYWKIPFDLFSDQVHYTAEGYKHLSDLLWAHIEMWNLQ